MLTEASKTAHQENPRLLFLTGELGVGGSERQLYYLLLAMNREHYRPVVVVWNYQESDTYVSKIRDLGVRLFWFPESFPRRKKLLALRRLVRQLVPEVVHSYSFYTNFAAYWSARNTKAVAIGSVRSDFMWARNEAGPVLGRLSARWPRVQICNSYSAAAKARNSGASFVAKKLLVVPNGLDLSRFRYSPPDTRKFRIAAVGSLSPVKRWDRLLRVTQQLKQRGLDFTVRVAGEGPLRDELKQQTQEFGLTGVVDFVGHVDDVAAWLVDSSVLLHTSDSEGCPNVVMEAMATGRTVVATAVGDVPSLVRDHKTGFVVSCTEEVALVDRLATLVARPELCVEFGQAAREKAKREFSLERLVSETLAAYEAAGWKDA